MKTQRSRAAATWRCFQVHAERNEAERVADLLHAATGVLTSLETKPGGHGVIVSAYVPRRSASRMAKRVRDVLGPWLVNTEQRDVAEEDWAHAWKRFYRPLKIAPGTHVAPTWEPDFRPPPGDRVLWLDPGMAFGTGLHASTRLAMALLLKHVKPKDVVFDIGCGSGILGLAAAQRGATVYSTDVDAIAVRAAKHNFKANGLPVAAIARARGVPATFPTAHIIAANITAAVLMHMGQALALRLKAGGMLVVSGFTQRSARSLDDTFQAAGLRRVDKRMSQSWLAHAYRKP